MKFSHLFFAATVVLVLWVFSPVEAVDGIAVSMRTHTTWQAYWDTTWKYEIRNDDVVTATPLFTGKSRYASINTAGTHIAFFNKMTNGDVYLSVMPLAGGTVVNMCKASTIKYGCAGGIIDWYRDDANQSYICYTTNNSWSDGDSNLYRIKYPEGGQPEIILHYAKAPLGAGQVSYDGRKAFFTLGATGIGMSKFTLTGTLAQNNASENNWCNVNCGAALSPMGTYLLNFDGSHDHYAMQTWGNTGNKCSNDLPTITASAYNSWCTNCNGVVVTCSKDYEGNPITPYTYTVGWGASGDQNRFSVNSDKWFSSDVGTLGRYASCGSNQVLINWVDHKTINVSKNPRSCDPNNVECDQNLPNRWTANEGGDFFVTAPLEDIIAPLQRTAISRQSSMQKRIGGNALSHKIAIGTFNVRGVRIDAQHATGVFVVRNKTSISRMVRLASH